MVGPNIIAMDNFAKVNKIIIIGTDDKEITISRFTDPENPNVQFIFDGDTEGESSITIMQLLMFVDKDYIKFYDADNNELNNVFIKNTGGKRKC